MSTEYTIIIVLSILLFLLAITTSSWYFIKSPKKIKSRETKVNNKLKLTLEKEQTNLKLLKIEAESLITKYNDKLMTLDYLDYPKIEQEVKRQIFQKKQEELSDELSNLEKNAEINAKNILINAMQHICDPLVQEITTTTITLPNDLMKGRIIGKDGRNKRSFEYLTGTDLIIEKENSLVTISSHNPIRREIAYQLLNELIKSKSIEPARIETIYSNLVNKFDQHIYETGQEFIENKLKIFDLPKELYPYMGRLKYRSSYGQNTLQHIWECAQLANTIANYLEVDSVMAIKCAIIHDIGKSVDYEIDKDHVTAGLKIAKELNLDDVLINSIESHHGQVVCDNIYSEIVAIVDSISASRPGARINSYEEYIERVQTLEKIVNELDEVNSSYVIRSGRHLRIMVNPSKVNDNNFEVFAKKIKTLLEADKLIGGYNIKVIIIKENRYEFETEAKKHLLD